MSWRFEGEAERVLCAEYLAGASCSRLAAKYGAQITTVSRTLRRNGIAIRANGKKPRPLSVAQEGQIVERHQQGATLSSLSKAFSTHHRRIAAVLRRHGIETFLSNGSGHLAPNWKGGRARTQGGYVRVFVDRADPVVGALAHRSGYALEHRVVMARCLGRPLGRQETVHHINGVKHDNRPENLQLHRSNHGSGVVLCCGECGSLNLVERPLG